MVPDRDAVFVDTMFEAPTPHRRVAHDTIRFGHLIDLDMATAQSGAPRIQSFGKLDERLDFAAPAVAIFRE
jgi:hypothetical protein